jgi:hypothetical protein
MTFKRKCAFTLNLSSAIQIKYAGSSENLILGMRPNYGALLMPPLVYGTVTGLVIGLIMIPLAVMGPQRVLSSYQALYEEVILGGVAGNADGRVEFL